MAISSTPQRYGASLVVADSTELAALNPDGLTIGSSCFNAAVGQTFTLTVSTAALDPNVVVAVANTTGARWVLTVAPNAAHAATADLAATATAPADAVTFATALGLDWLQSVKRQVVALDATLVRPAVFSNCVNIASEMNLAAATGTGLVAAGTTIPGGGAHVTSGGTAGGLQIGNLGVEAASRPIVNARTSHYAIYARAKVITGPTTGAQQLTVCNVFDGTNDFCLGNFSTTSQANWTFGSHGGTPVSTGVAFGSTYKDLLIWNDGTNLNAYIDGVLKGTLLSSTIASAAGRARIFAYNGSATATLDFNLVRWALFTAEAS